MLTYDGYFRANIKTMAPPIDAPTIHIGSVKPFLSKNYNRYQMMIKRKNDLLYITNLSLSTNLSIV
jgi:hypothetical protein